MSSIVLIQLSTWGIYLPLTILSLNGRKYRQFRNCILPWLQSTQNSPLYGTVLLTHMEETKESACTLQLHQLCFRICAYLVDKNSAKKNMFHWEPAHQLALEKMEHLIVCNVSLPTFEVPIEVYIDNNDYLMSAVIFKIIGW